MKRTGTTPRRLALAMGLGIVVCASMATGGCGGSSSSSPAAEASGSTAHEKTVAGKTEPEVSVPDTPPPRELVVKNLEIGHGPRAVVGDHVKVEYTGVNWGGVAYSNSWNYPAPPIFALGIRAGRRLEYGMDLAVRGMRPGGRREVIIPPRLIYWPDRPPERRLRPIDTLVFVIDLVAITKRAGEKAG